MPNLKSCFFLQATAGVFKKVMLPAVETTEITVLQCHCVKKKCCKILEGHLCL